MTHTLQFEKRVSYDRLSNGIDIYSLTTQSKDIVVCSIAFPGGYYATYDNMSIGDILDAVLPGSTRTKKRSYILEKFELWGAKVSFSVTSNTLTVSIRSRKEVFTNVLDLVVLILEERYCAPHEFEEAKMRLREGYVHDKDDTNTQARIALFRSLFTKGHPHWCTTLDESISLLKKVSIAHVEHFFEQTVRTVGAVVCIAGDVGGTRFLREVKKILEGMSRTEESVPPSFTYTELATQHDTDIVIPRKGKENVDTYIMTPMTLLKQDIDFLPLKIGVEAFGSGSTSRLFSILRTKENLTYGASASLKGFDEGYPGYCIGRALFQSTVFHRGRERLREEFKTFIEKGVSARELREVVEEIQGVFTVGLSTTTAQCSVLFATVLEKRPVREIDEYLDKVRALRLSEVNSAIKKHLSGSVIVTSACGAVTEQGTPL